MNLIYCDEHYIYTNNIKNLNLNSYFKVNDIKQICTKNNRTVILTYDHELYIFELSNFNDCYILIILKKEYNIRQISVSDKEILILDTNGKLVCIPDKINMGKCSDYDKRYIILDNPEILSINNIHDCHIINDNQYIIHIDIYNDIVNVMKYDLENIPSYLPDKILDNFPITKNKDGDKINKIDKSELGYTVSFKNGSLYEKFNHNPLGNWVLFRDTIRKIVCCDNYSLILSDKGKLYKLIDRSYKLICNDFQVYNCWILNNENYYIKYNGEFWKDDELICKNKNLKYIINTHINLSWRPEFHNNFPIYFRKNTLIILLYMKLIYRLYGIKLPKFVVYIIINNFI